MMSMMVFLCTPSAVPVLLPPLFIAAISPLRVAKPTKGLAYLTISYLRVLITFLCKDVLCSLNHDGKC